MLKATSSEVKKEHGAERDRQHGCLQLTVVELGASHGAECFTGILLLNYHSQISQAL